MGMLPRSSTSYSAEIAVGQRRLATAAMSLRESVLVRGNELSPKMPAVGTDGPIGPSPRGQSLQTDAGELPPVTTTRRQLPVRIRGR
jgi:hypothetical protein